MLLRLLVTNWIQGQAKQKLQGSVTDYLSQATSQNAEDPESQIDTVDVAIIMALGVEAGGLCDLLENKVTIAGPGFKEHVGYLGGTAVSLVESGVGAKSAANATKLILQSRQPKSVVSAGFATGLIAEARKGHIVMANEVTNTAGESQPIPFAISEEEAAGRKGLHVGRLLTVNKMISKVKQKQELAEQHQAIAMDMETAAVAKICAEHQVRFMSVRIITDGLMDQLPRHLEHMLKQKKTTSMLGAAASALINNPSSIKEMWNMRDVAMKASDRLARFLTGVIEQLAEPTDQ
ncbi:MAG: hypothetical protein COA78_24515 [Blastopirellula sp.]|nr:MAG: hypothetical protein COA78_24515 [Blastopirellula sp.]